MQVHIMRCPDTRPGDETWLQMQDDLVFVAAETGVTQHGADALVACWRRYIDAGTWRYRAPGGLAQLLTYHHLGHDGYVVAMDSVPGLTTTWLDPAHFTWLTVRAMQRAGQESLDTGWRYYGPLPQEGTPRRRFGAA